MAAQDALGRETVVEPPLNSLLPPGLEPGALLDPGHIFPLGEMQVRADPAPARGPR